MLADQPRPAIQIRRVRSHAHLNHHRGRVLKDPGRLEDLQPAADPQPQAAVLVGVQVHRPQQDEALRADVAQALRTTTMMSTGTTMIHGQLRSPMTIRHGMMPTHTPRRNHVQQQLVVVAVGRIVLPRVQD